jgi:hypothetical protein
MPSSSSSNKFLKIFMPLKLIPNCKAHLIKNRLLANVLFFLIDFSIVLLGDS